MSKETKKKQDQTEHKAKAKHVFTFRSKLDKAIGVSVWYMEATKERPDFLFYSPGERTYESPKSSKPRYSTILFGRNAKAHSEAVLMAGEFIDRYADNAPAGLAEGARLKDERDSTKGKEPDVELAAA